jgi:hypothetical protein
MPLTEAQRKAKTAAPENPFVKRAFQKGNAPKVVDRSPETLAKHGVELRNAAARQVAGVSDDNFNAFAIDRKTSPYFSELTRDQQAQVFRQSAGRNPSDAELQKAQGAKVSDVIYGFRGELSDRAKSGDPRAKAALSNLGQWEKGQKGPSNFRTFTTMAAIVGSAATGGITGAAILAGNQVGWAAYDEYRGEAVAWEKVASQAGVTLATASFNPGIRAGASFGASYVTTGDLGRATTSAAIAGIATGQSTGVQILADAAHESFVNGADNSDVAKRALTSLTIASGKSPSQRAALQVAAISQQKDVSFEGAFATVAGIATEGMKASEAGRSFSAPDKKYGVDFAFDPEAFSSENTTSLALREKQGQSISVARALPQSYRPAPAGLAVSRPQARPVQQRSTMALVAGGGGIARGGFNVY